MVGVETGGAAGIHFQVVLLDSHKSLLPLFFKKKEKSAGALLLCTEYFLFESNLVSAKRMGQRRAE